jgi:hypothetical protein
VRVWATEGGPFADQYKRARMIGYMQMADEIIAIADGGSVDPHRDRLRCDMRRWMLSKVLPKIFGDKIEVESTENIVVSEQGTPATNNFMRRLEQLAARQQQGYGRQHDDRDGVNLAPGITAIPPTAPAPPRKADEINRVADRIIDNAEFAPAEQDPSKHHSKVRTPAEEKPHPIWEDPGRLRSGCTLTRPPDLDRNLYEAPYVIGSDTFGRWRRG